MKVSLFLLFFSPPPPPLFIAVFTRTRSQATSSASSRAELSTTPCPPAHAGRKQVKVGHKPPKTARPKISIAPFPSPLLLSHRIPGAGTSRSAQAAQLWGCQHPPADTNRNKEIKKKANPSATMQSADFFPPPTPRGENKHKSPSEPTASSRDPCAGATSTSRGAKRGDRGDTPVPPEPLRAPSLTAGLEVEEPPGCHGRAAHPVRSIAAPSPAPRPPPTGGRRRRWGEVSLFIFPRRK